MTVKHLKELVDAAEKMQLENVMVFNPVTGLLIDLDTAYINGPDLQLNIINYEEN